MHPLRATVLSACLVIPAIAAADDSATLIDTIGFGSCAHQSREQPIWDAVNAVEPEIFLLLGDNVYADTLDMSKMARDYEMLNAKPGFATLRENALLMGTWDDHDYGVNDGGREYPMRAEAQQCFIDFFDFPDDHPIHEQEGVYNTRTFGPEGRRVQIIMLDTRYHRSPLTRSAPLEDRRGYRPYAPLWDDNATFLGEEQWAWLEEQLRQPADLRIIGSSIQFVAEDHWFEKWANLPLERQRLLDLINETGAEGVLFVSGDRHLAEISMMDGGVGYPIFDVTSSALTQSRDNVRYQEENRHRLGTLNWGRNFGVIQVDWEQDDPQIRLQIRDEIGDIMIQRKIRLSDLRRETAAGG